MAIISLRAYNREIEGMIDNGQLDEAVAHCRHILTTFPKHIASYRLLGKAHLEQQRISDATDIFQRVLTAIPDDFIPNVGMSIIREDENNLDAAIWHMELAYEAQPANIAIQDELRRLYGRRDGVQPPKVRLTRGALARMYSKSGLYDQAIAELRAAIVEDPNRLDLQQLLALMFYMTSQRVEAVEICLNILKKMPLCLEANRILAVSLPETEGSDTVKNYRQNVISMDPYYAFAEPDAISSDQVPENAVNIERLEWKSGYQIGETSNQPPWANSLGISMNKPPEEKIPDWLKSSEAPAPGSATEKASPSVSPFIWNTQEVEKIITDTSKPEDDIPDWMKDAGWKPSTGEPTPSSDKTKPQEPMAEATKSDELEKANLPEWLSGLAPEGAHGAEKQDNLPKEDDVSTPWLEPHQPGPTDSIIQWLEEKKPEAPTTPTIKGGNIDMGLEEEIPDWLKDLDLPQSTPAHESKPAETSPAFVPEPSAPSGETQTPGSTEAESTLTSGEGAGLPAAEAQPAETETTLPPEAAESEGSSAFIGEEIPDWLKDIAHAMPTTNVFISPGKETGLKTPLSTEPVLENEPPLAPGEASPEELPSAVVETMAQKSQELTSAPPEAQVPAAPEELPTAEVESVSEGLPTTPAAETPAITEEVRAAEVASISEEALTIEIPASPETLPSTEVPAFTAEQPQAEPSHLSETELAPAQPAPTSKAEEFDWLEGLIGDETSKAEGKVTPTPEDEITPPEWVKLETEPPMEKYTEPEPKPAAESSAVPAQEIPEWIKGLGEEPQIEPAPEVPTPAVPPATEPPQAETIPAWILEMEKPSEEIKAPISPTGALEWKEDKLPTWLKDITGSEETEKVPAPAEIHPAEETPATLVEPTTGQTEGVAPPIETGEKAPEVLQPEIGPWVPEVVAPVQPVSAIPVEAEAEPAPASEEAPTAPPISPTGALEWNEEKLPAWLKEIAETTPIEETAATLETPAAEELPAVPVEATAEKVEELIPPIEAPPAEELPSVPVEATAEKVEQIIPPIETGEKALGAPQPEAEISVPQVEEPAQPVPAIPLETEAEPASAVEEAPTTPPISPTGALEWNEEKLPAWLKEITETIPAEEAAATIETPTAEELPAVPVEATAEKVEEIIPPIEAGEKVLEASQPEAEPSIPQTEEPAQPVPAIPVEAEITPAVEEAPTKPPISPTGALAWKEDELPDWLKEITETIPAEEAAATIETPPAEEIPAVPVEATAERVEAVIPPIEAGEKVLEAPQPEAEPSVPQAEEPLQPVPGIPVKADAEPAPVVEEITPQAVEVTPLTPSEQVEPMVAMESEEDKTALAEARNAISQEQPTQAAGFYTGLIKHNYHLDEVIKDLHDALNRFPADIDLWVTLGDAEFRSNDAQEALNAYTKAEELVR